MNRISSILYFIGSWLKGTTPVETSASIKIAGSPASGNDVGFAIYNQDTEKTLHLNWAQSSQNAGMYAEGIGWLIRGNAADGKVYIKNDCMDITEPSVSITTNTGTLVSASVKRYGKVVCLTVKAKNSSAIDELNNLFQGELATTALRPLSGVVQSVTYLGARIVVGQLGDNGALYFRVVKGTITANAELSMTFTYLVA